MMEARCEFRSGNEFRVTTHAVLVVDGLWGEGAVTRIAHAARKGAEKTPRITRRYLRNSKGCNLDCGPAAADTFTPICRSRPPRSLQNWLSSRAKPWCR